MESNKADPYVVLRLGMEERRTRYKDDAGGTLVVFNEVLSFSKRLQDNLLRIQVLDKDTHTDDLMGELDVDLTKNELPPGGQSERPVPFEMLLKGKPAGKVLFFFKIFQHVFATFAPARTLK